MERKPRTISGISTLSRNRARAPRAADLIYQALHHDIASMTLTPNSKICEKDLVDRFGVSRTPVREAVRRLVEEGLVTVFPQAGTFVAPIPVTVLDQSILIRKTLEAVIAETAAIQAKPIDIEALDANLAALEARLAAGDLNQFHEIDNAFHRLIGRISALSTVMEIIEHVRVQIDRYRLLTLPQVGRLSRVITEHRAIRDAIAVGDARLAGAAMATHIGQMQDDFDLLQHSDAGNFQHDRTRGVRP